MKRKLAAAVICLVSIIGCDKSNNIKTANNDSVVSPIISPNDETESLQTNHIADEATPQTFMEPETASSEIPETSDDTEPAIDKPEQNCPELDTLRYDEAYYLFGDDVESTYGTECLDGHSYCYGQDNNPILMPKEPSGWGCRYVASMPNDKTFKHDYMYFEDVSSSQIFKDGIHRINRKYAKWAFMQAWVCEINDGCTCGNSPCPLNALCIDEKCYCNDKPYKKGKCTLEQPVFKSQSNEYSNDENDDNSNYTTEKPKRAPDGNIIENEYDTYCGNLKFNRDLHRCIKLKDGRIVLHFESNSSQRLESSDFYSTKNCISDETNDCKDDEASIRNITAERKRRSSDTNYQCGKETCVFQETCVNNHCVGLGTLKPLPSNQYTWEKYLPKCVEEQGCKCGSSTCKKDEFCTESGCSDYPYRKKIKGKWVRYASILTEYRNLAQMEYDDEIQEHTGFTPPEDDIWFDILTNKDAAACDNFTMPEHVEDYVCVFDGREDGCEEDPQLHLSAAGYFCSNPKGCQCGNASIPLYAGCRLGKVNYDSVYQMLACHHEMNHYLIQDMTAVSKQTDERGWCICGVSTVPPNMKGYYCNDHSMICKLKTGCDCGDIKCKFQESCIKPGECREN